MVDFGWNIYNPVFWNNAKLNSEMRNYKIGREYYREKSN